MGRVPHLHWPELITNGYIHGIDFPNYYYLLPTSPIAIINDICIQ